MSQNPTNQFNVYTFQAFFMLTKLCIYIFVKWKKNNRVKKTQARKKGNDPLCKAV